MTPRARGENAMTPVESAIHAFVREHAELETRFLAEIVKVPSDNPPGDCDRSAEAVAKLLEGLGFTVERHKVPDALVKVNGMISAINLIVRRRLGQGGPTIALNAHGDVVPPGSGWTHDPYGAEIVHGGWSGAGPQCRSRTSRHTRLQSALEKSGAALNGAVELHVTYDEEAGGEIGPRYILEQGLSRPDLASARASPTQLSTPTTAVCIWRSRCSAARPTLPGPRPE